MKFFYENRPSSINVGYGTSLAFEAHLHDHVELVYMIEGRTRTFVDFKEYIVEAGDVFLVFPNQIHQYQRIDKERYIVCIFPSEICPEFLSLFQEKVPTSPVIRHAENRIKILPILQEIIKIHETKPTFYKMRLKGNFLLLLSELFTVVTLQEQQGMAGNTIGELLNFCSNNRTKDLSLETVAEALHINKYYVSHLFSDKLHMGFKEYLASLRISDACHLLGIGEESITDIAYAVGFNSTRSFNRAFVKYMGVTPSWYRKHWRQESDEWDHGIE